MLTFMLYSGRIVSFKKGGKLKRESNILVRFVPMTKDHDQTNKIGFIMSWGWFIYRAVKYNDGVL